MALARFEVDMVLMQISLVKENRGFERTGSDRDVPCASKDRDVPHASNDRDVPHASNDRVRSE